MLRSLAVLALLCSSLLAQYDQPYRPQIHFSPREHWTNDPNGLVFYRGEYHLFFQYNPFGDKWGHMSWGHAVSTDLLHWKELPVAIPEQDGEMIFTGSVVVDRENTSGFCAPKTDCLVAIYTGHRDNGKGVRQTQNLAYSLDRGRTWKRYEKNPVLDLHMADFRDPSVFWDESAKHWLMSVALPKEHKVRFYSSPDLKQWTLLSDFGPMGDVDGDWECPDLLRIPSDDRKTSMWALKVGLNPGAPQGGSGEQYFLGNFDGKIFTPSGAHGWTNYGKDDYCAISFNNIPQDEKPVLLGWMNNWQYADKVPTSPWRGQMSLPRRVSFIKDDAGVALKQEAVLEPLHSGKPVEFTIAGTPLATENAPFELELMFTGQAQQPFGVRLYSDDKHWSEIGFDPQQSQFYIDRTRSGLDVAPGFPVRTDAPLVRGRAYDLHLIVDRSSIEAYAQGGTIAMTDLMFPPSRMFRIEVFGEHSNEVHGHLWRLKSIWTGGDVKTPTAVQPPR